MSVVPETSIDRELSDDALEAFEVERDTAAAL